MNIILNLYKKWEYFFPRGCSICRINLFNKEEILYGLCHNCRKNIIFDKSLRCKYCGRPLISEVDQCLTCRINAETEKPLFDRMFSVFPYNGKYIKLLSAFKYEKSLGAGQFLSEHMIKAIYILDKDLNQDFVLVPVPPRPGKIRKIGWDQIITLSHLISQRPDTPKIYQCLERKASLTQKKLDRKDRKTNLEGRIIAFKKPPQNCILFDDVITTGSTMNACANALKQAGAQIIHGICLFYD